MGGMQVGRRGGGQIALRAITTQMFGGSSLLTDVTAHVGKRKAVVFGGDRLLAGGVWFSRSQRQILPSTYLWPRTNLKRVKCVCPRLNGV